ASASTGGGARAQPGPHARIVRGTRSGESDRAPAGTRRDPLGKARDAIDPRLRILEQHDLAFVAQQRRAVRACVATRILDAQYEVESLLIELDQVGSARRRLERVVDALPRVLPSARHAARAKLRYVIDSIDLSP